MERPVPPSDWVVYVVVFGTVAAMLLGKWLMFFNDKKQESSTKQPDDTTKENTSEITDKVKNDKS